MFTCLIYRPIMSSERLDGPAIMEVMLLLSGCLSVYTSQNRSFRFSVHVTLVTYGCGSVLLWRQCNMLCTSGFVNDVIFLCNGSKESTTLCVEFARWRHMDEFCRLRLHFIKKTCSKRSSDALKLSTIDILISAWNVQQSQRQVAEENR